MFSLLENKNHQLFFIFWKEDHPVSNFKISKKEKRDRQNFIIIFWLFLGENFFPKKSHEKKFFKAFFLGLSLWFFSFSRREIKIYFHILEIIYEMYFRNFSTIQPALIWASHKIRICLQTFSSILPNLTWSKPFLVKQIFSLHFMISISNSRLSSEYCDIFEIIKLGEFFILIKLKVCVAD